MIQQLKKAIELVEKELARDKSLMEDKDIFYDEGYIAGVSYVVGLLEEEERQQTYCTSCKKITNSSRADYQDEFTCNDCGAEVQEEE